MSNLTPQIEYNKNLARWLGVKEVVLVREDLLPDGGGKKRRALVRFIESLEAVDHIHVLSYAGSHTAFTLSKLLPQVMIHLYGTHYGGGPYEDAMVKQLNMQENIIQKVGSTWSMTLAFNRQKRHARPGHHFMNIGGSLGADHSTQYAVEETIKTIGSDFHHVVAVASGDLLASIFSQIKAVSGVLTQPLAIRLLKIFSLNNVSGLWKSPLKHRIATMRSLGEMTGVTWDPIFMGSVFTFLKRKRILPPKLCIWVTCPSGIDW